MLISAGRSIKPVFWIGSAKANLSAFPEEVKDSIGFALYVAQQGGKHASVKPLRGFGDAGVLEVVENHGGDTCRAVYAVKFAGRVYVLHSFQKKSKSGIATPKAEVNVIKSRLKRTEEEHAAWLNRQKEIERKWLKQSTSRKEAAMSSPTSAYQTRKNASRRVILLFVSLASFVHGDSPKQVQPAS